MKTTLINSGNVSYLSEIMSDLPHNCLFNKVITGSGGTTIALSNKENYIICVPFKSLINSKTKQHTNILGVMGGVSDYTIENYLEKNITKKIMVTYDSLERLIKFIEPKDFRLLIDESHKLIDSGSFRSEAIRGVINNFKKFKSYTFMTATPVKDKYQHPLLKNIPKVTMSWSNIEPVSVNYKMLENNFSTKIASLAVDFIKNEKNNVYFFINSVKSITTIISKLKKAGYDDPNLYKIVVAENKDNNDYIKSKLGKTYNIETIDTPNKKINFLTSTAFEGCDIYDSEGITYILTDGTKDHTKIDILTLLPQIIGRIRNSKFKNTVNVLFTPSPYFSHITEDEFEKYVKEQMIEAKGYIKTYKESSLESVKIALKETAKTNAFILIENDELSPNTEVWYSEMHNFESLHTTYYVQRVNGNLIGRTDNFNVNINNIPYNYKPSPLSIDLSLVDKMKLNQEVSLQKITNQYCEDKDNEIISDLVKEVEYNKEYKYIREGYSKLGYKKLKALEFRKKDIQEELLILDKHKENEYKIVNLLNYRVGSFIPLNEVKESLQEVYNRLNIKINAKATDLNLYYETKNKFIKRDGKTVRGCVIVLNKIK